MMGLVSLSALLISIVAVAHLRAQRVLLLSERGLRAFGEFAPVLMYIRDARGSYTHVNASFLMIAASGSGRPSGSAIAAACIDPEWRALDESVLAARRQSSSVVELDRGDSRRTFHVVRFPIFGARGEDIIGVGGIGIDITQEVHARQESRMLSETRALQLGQGTAARPANGGLTEAAITEKIELLSMIAHEIQTPVSAITGIAFLMGQTLAHEQSGQVSSLIEASNYLSAVVRNALDFSRLEAGRMDIQFRRFSLRKRIQHVLELAWRDAMAHEASLFVSLSPDVPDAVIGDDVRIMQILLNYIQNAIKYGGPGLVVLEVSADSVNGLLHDFTFAVRDRGPGVAPDQLSGLFKPFPQQAGRSKGNGNGLGLSITRRIADLMGGETWMESKPGQGAAFFAKLPLIVDVSRACTHKALPYSGKRVWVVDPCAASRAAISSGLAGRGALVEAAADKWPPRPIADPGAAGSGAPDYVIVDWRSYSQEFVDRLDAQFEKDRAHFIVLGPPLSCWKEGIPAARDRTQLRFKPTLLSEFCGSSAAACASCQGSVTEQEGHIDRNCLAGRAVLLAEDDDIVRSVLREILVLAGAVVRVARDGHEALGILRHSDVDILLMDIQMPGLNGFETAEQIRTMPDMRDLPVIAITASLSDADRATAARCGVTCVLTKPVNPYRLLALMVRLLGLRGHDELAQAAHVLALGEDEPDTGAFRRISGQIAALDEIRIDSALARLGGRHEIFVDIVRRVVERAASPQSPIDLLAAFKDAESARSAFHKLVSELGIIGAENLQAEACELETAARESALDHGAVAMFVERYRKLIADLRGAAYPV
ncbi:hybrid sensor histidine kinase/response regulator [Achromobacter sp. NPDC058515]|uniref:hybrid sensor histidine kinase/response regulator n=1 Tax=Achromobacter sp. NPDC058515 TaxID=3346533 RepID=UPI003649BFB9